MLDVFFISICIYFSAKSVLSVYYLYWQLVYWSISVQCVLALFVSSLVLSQGEGAKTIGVVRLNFAFFASLALWTDTLVLNQC